MVSRYVPASWRNRCAVLRDVQPRAEPTKGHPQHEQHSRDDRPDWPGTIDNTENSEGGSALGSFYIDKRVLDWDKFYVWITP